MSDTDASTNSSGKRRRFRFGMRTIFVLIVFVALGAWWVRNEMLKEQRREELAAELSGDKSIYLQFNPTAPIPWPRKWRAWLRGKPPGPELDTAQIHEIKELSKLQELAESFPEASYSVEITRKDHDVHKLLRVLARVKHLVFANLPSVEANDETMAGLGRIRPKNAVWFSAKQVDDDLLRKAADANVDVGWIWDHEQRGWGSGWDRVTNQGLRIAASFRKLDRLVAGRNAGDEGLAAFNGHPAIHTAELTGPGYTDASAETLASIASLNSLALLETRLTDAGIAKAIGNHSLQSLELSKTQLGEESIAAIAKLTKLRMIELEDVPLSPELVAALSKLPIDNLSIRGDYTDADLTQLAPLAPALKYISLKTPNVTDRGLHWLSGAVNISGLRLSDTQATAETMKIISTKSPQVLLELGGPHINATVIAEAHHTFKVARFSLYGDTINDDTLAAVEPTSVFPILAGTRVTAKGLSAFKTNGKKTPVVIYYAENTQPPLTSQEIEDIKRDTGGLVEVNQHAIPPKVFENLMPKSSRKPVAEVESP